MDRAALNRLSKDELVEAYLALQARLQRPQKTSRTSSKPPSSDTKERRNKAKPGGARPGHKGHFRSLHDDPDETVDHRPHACPCCHGKLDGTLCGDVIGQYDEIELPMLKPFVRRHRRLAVNCPHCRARVNGPLPDVAKSSPFGPRLHALALYLKTFQSVSFARLAGMFADVFNLSVSQGALANMLKRSHAPFATGKDEIIGRLRRADMVASDETASALKV